MAKLFLSYAHEDSTFRDRIMASLAVLRNQGHIEVFHDRRIRAGQNFEEEINQNLENADIILLLVSPDFLDSDYCWNIEMNRALERHRTKEAVVIPVILRMCEWKETDLRHLMATPTAGEAISTWTDQDSAYHDIVQSIREVVIARNSLQEQQQGPKPILAERVSQPVKSTSETRAPGVRGDEITHFCRNVLSELNNKILLEKTFNIKDNYAKFYAGEGRYFFFGNSGHILNRKWLEDVMLYYFIRFLDRTASAQSDCEFMIIWNREGDRDLNGNRGIADRMNRYVVEVNDALGGLTLSRSRPTALIDSDGNLAVASRRRLAIQTDVEVAVDELRFLNEEIEPVVVEIVRKR